MTLHRHNGFYTLQTVCAIALHLNLALTGDCAFLLSPRKTHSVWFISVLNYGDTENVLINHLPIVIPVSYPCHYTNLCPHKPHKHTHTHTHIHTNHIVSLEVERTWYNINCFHIWSEAIFSQFSYQWEEAAATGQDRLWVFPLVAMGENEIPQPSQKFYLHDQFSKWKLILLLSVILLLICAILFLITVNYFRRQHVTQYYLWYSYFYIFLLFCLHFNFN